MAMPGYSIKYDVWGAEVRSPLNAGVACNITLHGEPRDGNAWWSLACGAITARGSNIHPSHHGWSSCPEGSSGPQYVPQPPITRPPSPTPFPPFHVWPCADWDKKWQHASRPAWMQLLL